MVDAVASERIPGFAALVRELEARGYFRPAAFGPLVDFASTLVASLALFVAAARVPLWAAAPLFVTGSVLYARIGWAMHDAAHGNLCGSRRLNETLNRVFCFLLGEFPSGWRHGHDAHHRAPNVRSVDRDKRERWDPDRRYRSRLWAAIDLLLLVRRNGITLPRLLLLIAVRDGSYARRARPDLFRRELLTAVAGTLSQIALFVVLYGGWGIALYVVYSWIAGSYLNLVFAGNHYDRPAWDEPPGLDVAALQITAASNYTGGAAMRAFCGGLEHQIEHHLFPRMPRRHLRRAAPVVRSYCLERGLPYVERPFSHAIRSVIDYHVVPEPRPGS